MSQLRLNWKKHILGRSGRGFFLLGLFFSLLAFANFSSLHKSFHPNAANPDHQCGAKLLSSGQVHAPADDSVVVVRSFLALPSLPESFSLVRNFFDLPPARAPPVSPA